MKTEILIVGAGAAGLMAARELVKAGKKVMILEARDRIGGRIFPLPEEEFGFQVQGGAEFVHGPAPVTKSLLKEAGLTYVQINADMWSAYEGKLELRQEMFPHGDLIKEKLREVKEDMPISIFLEKYFGGEEYKVLRESILEIVEEYDAADSDKVSTFTLRDEWLGGHEWIQGRVKEGYGPFLKFLELECKNNGVEIHLGQEVKKVEMTDDGVRIECKGSERYEAEKAIITLPMSVIPLLEFVPAIPEKTEAASKIGFGGVIKIIFQFKDDWWSASIPRESDKFGFIISREEVPIWLSSEYHPVLTGWIGGRRTEKFKDVSSEEMLGAALVSLSNIFGIDGSVLKDKLTKWKVMNWPADPFSQGAYSYSVVGSERYYKELRDPVDNKIFFAGEALYNGQETATVEGALASGLETAKNILNK